MSTEPEYNYLYVLLRRALAPIRMGTGLDVGCSTLINANFFATERYIGLDMQEDRLREGLTRPRLRPNVSAVVADMHDLDRLPPACASVVACTNVLHWLSPSDTARAVDSMAGLCQRGGTLVLNIEQKRDGTAAIVSRLREQFDDVNVTPYMNRLTRRVYQAYTWFDRRLGRRWSNRVFRWLGITSLLFAVEERTGRGHMIFIAARGRKDAGPDQDLSVDDMTRVGPDLYRLTRVPLPTGVTSENLGEWAPGQAWL